MRSYGVLAEEESAGSEVQISDGGHADRVLLQLVRHGGRLRVLGDQHVVGQNGRARHHLLTAFLEGSR